MIGRSGERGSGISVLAARHDDDDDDDGCVGFFEETVSGKYLPYLPSVYGVKYLGKVLKK